MTNDYHFGTIHIDKMVKKKKKIDFFKFVNRKCVEMLIVYNAYRKKTVSNSVEFWMNENNSWFKNTAITVQYHGFHTFSGYRSV